MKIAIIDIIGIPYDGTTLKKQGLGGSESAVILNSKELAEIGFDVTVFNSCDIDHASPGVYDNVRYLPLSDLANDHYFDIVISSRTVIPFTDPIDYPKLGDNRAAPFHSMNLYDRILANAKMRILWMHDTFCLGDALIEDLAISNRITDIFTLSDWHLTYIANCNHGRMRNFEVLKRKLFITRNGAKNYNKEVDITAKDRNLFVYNASATKGMIPLVEQIWPRIKQYIPQAKLKVIGGYYRFSLNSAPDEQEKKWREMANDQRNADLDIEFTGVISQIDISNILTKANFMIYPSAFPETYGISTLESLLYNTPVLTCRFGALEEIALEGACYHIDYAIEPNGLFPNISLPHQVERFVEMTVNAYHNQYLHQQKQYYCNIIKDIAGWDSVALQWKQHILRSTGAYLSRDEYRAVTKLNHKVHKTWKRRYHNVVEMESHKLGREKEIIVITPFYNCEKYIARCIESIATQDYDNYKVILIDDCSTDNTVNIVLSMLDSLPKDINEKFSLIVNDKNQGAVCNQIYHIREVTNPDAIIMLIDGDDSLTNDNSIFSYFNGIYEDAEFTYGSCWSMVDNIPLISQPYPESVKTTKTYRSHHFNWIMPYTHLRTFKKLLLDNIDDSTFQDEAGDWYKAGGDGSVFYALIEAADPKKVKCLQEIVYNYNDTNPLNDYKINGDEQTRNARKIIGKMANVQKKRILIAIPTANNIEVTTFKSVYDLIVPDDVEVDFQYFYGYQIDQIRNLIADWVVKGYDYLFSVDSDISFPKDTLVKLLAHNKDVVCGLYIQRIPGTHTLELYEKNIYGGMSNIPAEKLPINSLYEIAGCGFGCTLVKKEVMVTIGYPQFKYYSAIEHKDTVSEDVDFCTKAAAKGFRLWADTSILCAHTGKFTFNVDRNLMNKVQVRRIEEKLFNIQDRLRDLSNMKLMPQKHVDYLKVIRDIFGFSPKVIYDVGACVLHWTKEASNVWPNAEIIAFEAMESTEFLFQENNMKYHMGLLSSEDGKIIEFYQNEMHPGGNSYYKENIEVNPTAVDYTSKLMTTATLNTAVKNKQFPLPDMIKMDVQGAEMDILKGSTDILTNVRHVILELQQVEYNKGAPLNETVIEYMDSIGFNSIGMFNSNGPDGDYHFVNRAFLDK
jgi:FkbM family methyltransferase